MQTRQTSVCVFALIPAFVSECSACVRACGLCEVCACVARGFPSHHDRGVSYQRVTSGPGRRAGRPGRGLDLRPRRSVTQNRDSDPRDAGAATSTVTVAVTATRPWAVTQRVVTTG